MRIDLELRSLSEVIDGLREVAEAFDEVADARERATAGAAKPSLVSQVNDLGRNSGDFLGRQTFGDTSKSAGRPLNAGSEPARPEPAKEMTLRTPDLVQAIRDLGRPLRAVLGAGHAFGSAAKGDPAAGINMAAGIADRGFRSAAEEASGEPWGIVIGLASAAFTTAIAAFVGGFALVTSAVHEATQAGSGFAASRAVTGGSTADVSGLLRFGISPTQAGGAADQFRASAQSDSSVRAARAQMGLGPVSSSPYADLNSADLYAQTLEKLSAEKDPKRQLRLARQLHMEGALSSLRVSPDVRTQRTRGAQDTGDVFNPQLQQDARDLTAQFDLVGNGFTNLIAAFAGPSLGDVKVFTGMVLDWLHDGLPLAKEFGTLMHENFAEMVAGAARVGAVLHHLLDGPTRERDIKERGILGPFQAAEEDTARIVAEFKRRRGGGKGAYEDTSSGAYPWQMINNNDFRNQLSRTGGAIPGNSRSGTASAQGSALPSSMQAAQLQATRDLIIALNGVRGDFGGGSRTRGAIPAAFLASEPGDQRRKFLEMQSLQLGFWGSGNA